VHILALEQGILPHERSLGNKEDIEEERRLMFVGMTRAKEELYLCHARLRDFRGNTLYTVPSFFLEELGERAEVSLERIDLSAEVGTTQSIDRWRSGGRAALPGWSDAGITPRWGKPSPPASSSGASTKNDQHYEPGMHVRHETYGE